MPEAVSHTPRPTRQAVTCEPREQSRSLSTRESAVFDSLGVAVHWWQ